VNTVHQPEFSACRNGRKDVMSIPMMGIIQAMHRSSRTSLVPQPAFAGLGSKVVARLRVLDVGVATAGVATVSVMRWPPRP
jgi:hypothetical protein